MSSSKLSVRVESNHLPAVQETLRDLDVDVEANLDGVDWFFSVESPNGVPVRLTAPIRNTSLEVRIEPGESVYKPFRYSDTVDVVVECRNPEEVKQGRDWMRRFLELYRDKRRDLCLAVGSFLANSHAAWHSLEIAKVNIPSFHPVRETIFKDFELRRLSDPRNGSLKIERLKNLDGEEISVHTNARYYYRHEQTRIVLDLHDNGSIHLAGDGIASEELDKLIEQIDTSIQESFGSLSRAITPSGEPVVLDQPVTWDNLYLNPDTRETLQSEVSKFFGNRELFERMGIPHRRGLLLHGKPGTGKTMFGKVLVTSIERCLFVWITAAEAMNARNIHDIFSVARRANRAILFFEDLDMYAARRGRHHDASSLGELMGQMDGMHSNEGIMVIATTNDLAAIEPALRDRPSRFDRVIEITPPNAEIRSSFLKNLLSDFGVTDEQIANITNATNEFTGAQIKELALVAKSQAAQRGSERIGLEDLDEAVEQARRFKSMPTGFAAGADAEPDPFDHDAYL